MKQTDLAWAAGLIDGEGCITIARRRPSKSSRTKSTYYLPVLRVAMCHRPTLQKLCDMFELGTVHGNPASKHGHTQSYAWMIQARPVGEVVSAILPFLVTKKKEAEILMQFIRLGTGKKGGNRGSPVISQIIQRKRELLYWKIRKAKTRWRYYAERESVQS